MINPKNDSFLGVFPERVSAIIIYNSVLESCVSAIENKSFKECGACSIIMLSVVALDVNDFTERDAMMA